MSNIPKNAREFNLEMAQQDHPLVTRDGRPAKFIAYVPEADQGFKLVVMIGNTVHTTREDGKFNNWNWDLFLAPLGMCEGKPVFANDILTGKDNPCYDGKEFVVKIGHNWFEKFKWPSKAPKVETRISANELRNVYNSDLGGPVDKALTAVANKAIERAILDGDVIPTSVVKELMKEMTRYDWDRFAGIVDDEIEISIQQYKDELK